MPPLVRPLSAAALEYVFASVTDGNLAQIRDARLADLDAIAEIYNSSIPSRTATADLEPVSAAARRPWFDRHTPARRPLWVLERAGRIDGWLSFEDFVGRAAYAATAELSVYVRADRRRRGTGEALLAHALAHAPALGLETLLAVVFAHNDASVGLFERHGFERWGLLPRVARLDGRDASVLILGRRVEG